MYTLGALLLSALLLGAVISVIESVLQLVGAHGAISKLPIIGAHLSLIIAIGMVWLLDMNPIAGWGVSFSDEWMTYVANGALILGMIPMKDAVINMVNNGDQSNRNALSRLPLPLAPGSQVGCLLRRSGHPVGI